MPSKESEPEISESQKRKGRYMKKPTKWKENEKGKESNPRRTDASHPSRLRAVLRPIEGRNDEQRSDL